MSPSPPDLAATLRAAVDRYSARRENRLPADDDLAVLIVAAERWAASSTPSDDSERRWLNARVEYQEPMSSLIGTVVAVSPGEPVLTVRWDDDPEVTYAESPSTIARVAGPAGAPEEEPTPDEVEALSLRIMAEHLSVGEVLGTERLRDGWRAFADRGWTRSMQSWGTTERDALETLQRTLAAARPAAEGSQGSPGGREETTT